MTTETTHDVPAASGALSDDELIDAARALAVLDRLWAMPAVTSVTMWREFGACVVKAMIDAGLVGSLRGEGETPAAALLALGARLKADDDGKQ